MIIENFGSRVASVWEGIRPSTRHLVERALNAAQAPAGENAVAPSQSRASYDARSEWELSRLLAALDERASEPSEVVLSNEQALELGRVADTCADVLHREARSAEVYAQLFERALRSHNYRRVDVLADTLRDRLAPSETCELARHSNPAVRAIAYETLLLMPTPTLIGMLGDPIDADVARDALEYQADEFGSEEARWIVEALDRAESSPDEL